MENKTQNIPETVTPHQEGVETGERKSIGERLKGSASLFVENIKSKFGKTEKSPSEINENLDAVDQSEENASVAAEAATAVESTFGQRFLHILKRTPEFAKKATPEIVKTAASIFGVKSPYVLVKYAMEKYQTGEEKKGLSQAMEGQHGLTGEDLDALEEAKWKKIFENAGISIEGKTAEELQSEVEVDENTAEGQELLNEYSVDQAVLDQVAGVSKRIGESKFLSPEKKQELFDKLNQKIQAFRHNEDQADADEAMSVEETLDSFIKTKTKGAEVIKELINTTSMLTGMVHVRAVGYGAISLLERHQKQQELKGENYSFFKDTMVNGVKETARGLTVRSEDVEGKKLSKFERGLKFVKSSGTIGRFVGISAPALTGMDFNDLENFQKSVETIKSGNIVDLFLQRQGEIADRYAGLGRRLGNLVGPTEAQAAEHLAGTSGGVGFIAEKPADMPTDENLDKLYGVSHDSETHLDSGVPVQTDHTLNEGMSESEQTIILKEVGSIKKGEGVIKAMHRMAKTLSPEQKATFTQTWMGDKFDAKADLDGQYNAALEKWTSNNQLLNNVEPGDTIYLTPGGDMEVLREGMPVAEINLDHIAHEIPASHEVPVVHEAPIAHEATISHETPVAEQAVTEEPIGPDESHKFPEITSEQVDVEYAAEHHDVGEFDQSQIKVMGESSHVPWDGQPDVRPKVGDIVVETGIRSPYRPIFRFSSDTNTYVGVNNDETYSPKEFYDRYSSHNQLTKLNEQAISEFENSFGRADAHDAATAAAPAHEVVSTPVHESIPAEPAKPEYKVAIEPGVHKSFGAEFIDEQAKEFPKGVRVEIDQNLKNRLPKGFFFTKGELQLPNYQYLRFGELDGVVTTDIRIFTSGKNLIVEALNSDGGRDQVELTMKGVILNQTHIDAAEPDLEYKVADLEAKIPSGVRMEPSATNFMANHGFEYSKGNLKLPNGTEQHFSASDKVTFTENNGLLKMVVQKGNGITMRAEFNDSAKISHQLTEQIAQIQEGNINANLNADYIYQNGKISEINIKGNSSGYIPGFNINFSEDLNKLMMVPGTKLSEVELNSDVYTLKLYELLIHKNHELGLDNTKENLALKQFFAMQKEEIIKNYGNVLTGSLAENEILAK